VKQMKKRMPRIHQQPEFSSPQQRCCNRVCPFSVLPCPRTQRHMFTSQYVCSACISDDRSHAGIAWENET